MQNINTFNIQRAILKDLNLLQEISINTFAATFSSSNSAENIAGYIEKNLNLQQLALELNNPNSHFYIAYVNAKAVGYIKINFSDAQTEKIAGNTLEIHRIYVLQSFHGKSIGQILLDKALHIARDAKCENVWLGVWELNHKAIQFYNKNSFIVFDKHDFMMGNDKQTDLLMKLSLLN